MIRDIELIPAGHEFDAEIARTLYHYEGIGYYGPPEDGSAWMHEKSVRHDTPEAADESYRRLYGETKDNLGFWSLCHWKEGWGPLSLPDWSTHTYDALKLLKEWENYDIQRRNGSFTVELFEPSREHKAQAETLALAICRARLLAVRRSAE